jgi:hypothetical protein
MNRIINWKPTLIGLHKWKPRVDFVIPRSFMGEESSLYNIFIQFAKRYQDNEKKAVQRYVFLPDSIKKAHVWFDKITDMWRYEFGLPYDRLPEQMIISGTNVHLPVEELYLAIKIADQRLTPTQLIAYRERLAQIEKHTAAIFEMRPLKNIMKGMNVRYEVSGFGQGRTSLDWQVKGRCLNIAFDVKYRVKPLLDHIKQTIPAMNRGAATATASSPDPVDLFRSTDSKFRDCCFLRRQQGIWVCTEVKEELEKLRSYFKNTLSKRKVHFVVFSDWKDDAYILARNRLISSALKHVFCLTDSERFVVENYDKAAVERVTED